MGGGVGAGVTGTKVAGQSSGLESGHGVAPGVNEAWRVENVLESWGLAGLSGCEFCPQGSRAPSILEVSDSALPDGR